MVIDFAKPIWLLLIFAAIALLFFTSKALDNRAKTKKAIILAARFVIFSFLILQTILSTLEKLLL